MGYTYKASGVNVQTGNEAVRLMKKHAESTFNEHVLQGLGSFGAMYDNGEDVLVSGTDGVGTKLKIAFALDKHDTIGIDCVAMCVNDIICHGAKPMFFLDYLATGRLDPEVAEQIVGGIAEGCRQSGCALIGGETAEMPGFYSEGEYDLAGFCVGSVSKSKLITGKDIKAGDVLIGLKSSGVHSNGFSLVRALISMNEKTLTQNIDSLDNELGKELLTPTKIYVKTILGLIDKFDIKGVAHITGGGFFENIPRIFPSGIGAQIDLGSWDMPKIFDILQGDGAVSRDEMFSTFNMGIGMVIAVNKDNAKDVLYAARDLGEESYIIGKTMEGSGVQLCE